MLQTSKEIIDKYKLKGYWELFYHYTIIGGELPSNLANEIFNRNTMNTILYRGSHTKSFKLYREHNIYGYQLTKTGKERAARLTYDYTPYLNTNIEKAENTKDTSKRTRFRNRAFLYHFLDVLEIEYMRERTNKENTQNTFVDSRQIKKRFDAEKEQFAYRPDREFQISGSKAYGVVELEKHTQYITYVIYDWLEKLQFLTESHFTSMTQKYLESEYYGTIFFTKNTFISNNIVSRIVSQILDIEEYGFDNDKESQKLFKYFRQAENKYFDKPRYLGMHIISFDEVGQKQMEALKSRIQFNHKIREVLYQNEEHHIINDEIKYFDGVYNGIPCEFLYSLDIQKLIKNLRLISRNTNQELIIICFKEHRSTIKYLMNQVNNEYSNNKIYYVTLEELGLA